MSPRRGRNVTASFHHGSGRRATSAFSPPPEIRTRILIVDDDASTREALAECLTEDGFDVATASDGREASQLVERVEPDVALLDLVMPGMDGWAFRAEQRNRPAIAEIPIIVTPGMTPVVPSSLDPATLSKPFTIEAHGSDPGGGRAACEVRLAYRRTGGTVEFTGLRLLQTARLQRHGRAISAGAASRSGRTPARLVREQASGIAARAKITELLSPRIPTGARSSSPVEVMEPATPAGLLEASLTPPIASP